MVEDNENVKILHESEDSIFTCAFDKDNIIELKYKIFDYINKIQANYYFNNAFTYVFPSIDEGFGIPLIEAMRAQVPVICSDIEVFKEIGNDSVVYFKKQNYYDLYNQLQLVCEDKSIVERLILKGIKRANLFNQKNFIKGFEKLY